MPATNQAVTMAHFMVMERKAKMITRKYYSKTNFIPDRELTIYESVDERYTKNTYVGFISLEEAQAFTADWQETWEFGYFGSAYVEQGPNGIQVQTRRRNSCD